MPSAITSAMGAIVLGLGLAAGASVHHAAAQDPDEVRKVANYTGEDRQEMLEAGAREEGALLVYTTGTQIAPLIDQFEEKYPFISVELYRAGSADVAARVYEEYQAGHFAVDGFELASHGLVVPREAGILVPYQTPEAVNYPDDAKEPSGHWIVARESYTGIGFNTELAPPNEAPRTFDDLLDPKWKGKMAISGSLATAANWVGTMLLTKGEDYLDQLAEQDIRVYEMTGRALANLMAAGEVAVSPTTYNSHVGASAAEGAPLGWISPEAVPVTDTGVAIAARAPHPHAMMLLIDFLLTRESQEVYQEIGYSSAHNDLESENAPKKKLYLTNRPNYIRDFEEWAALYKELFLRSTR